MSECRTERRMDNSIAATGYAIFCVAALKPSHPVSGCATIVLVPDILTPLPNREMDVINTPGIRLHVAIIKDC
jgi:hypothetical protein